MSKTLYDFTAKSLLTGEAIDFAALRGKPVIVVNGASKCGYTAGSYAGLSALLDRFHESAGLQVVVFPCNQFMGQEPGSPEQIACMVGGYDKRMLITERVDVNGGGAHPLWKWLKTECPGTLVNAIKWNFTKFIIDRQGRAVARFGPNDEPSKMTPKLEEVIAQNP